MVLSIFISSPRLTSSFPGEERVRGLKGNVTVWALWESDFEMEISVLGASWGASVVEGKGRRERKERKDFLQREKISCNIVSTEASAVPTGAEMGEPSERSCLGKEDWAFRPLCPSVIEMWPPLGKGHGLG